MPTGKMSTGRAFVFQILKAYKKISQGKAECMLGNAANRFGLRKSNSVWYTGCLSLCPQNQLALL
jgi:hypothetical protein